jgi:hypothetical protein
MKNALFMCLLALVLASNSLAAGKGPDIRIIDNRVSMQAEAVPLSRLLKLLDRVTGMTSKVPPELANRNVSVRFSNLSFDDAIHKIFEGLPLDYVVVQGQGIMVTGISQTITATSSAAPFSPPPPQDSFTEENPAFAPPGQVPFQPGNANPPAMIQTPFGPRPNPNAAANQNIQQQGIMPGGATTIVPNNGMSPMAPNQPANNPFNSTLPGFNTQPGTINSTPNNQPFGSNPVFPNQPAQPNSTPPGYPMGTRPIP